MRIGLIEINDSGLDVSLDGRPLMRSPGYAVIANQRLLVGAEAMQNARLLPRWTHTRFWQQLDTQMLKVGHPQIRHSADLAYAHLASIWTAIKDRRPDAVVLATPGDYSREQLSLLLGIAKEVGLPVQGLIDTALVAANGHPLNQQVLFLDIHLHRVTLSELQTRNERRHAKTVTVTDSGLHRLWDRWADSIAKQFIRSSRFDPLHDGISEQRLFDALPDWMRSREELADLPFELVLDTRAYQTPVSTEHLLPACESLYPLILQAIKAQVADQTATLLISHRFMGFPALMEALSMLKNVTVERLGPAAVMQGTGTHLDEILGENGQINLVTSLANPAADNHEVSPAIDRSATHLLFNYHATPIGQLLRLEGIHQGQLLKATEQARCVLNSRGGSVFVVAASIDRVYLNDHLVDGELEVKPGDQLVIDQQSIRFISLDQAPSTRP